MIYVIAYLVAGIALGFPTATYITLGIGLLAIMAIGILDT